MKLMREAAETAGYGDRWRPLPLAVTFDPDYSYDRPEPFSDKNSKTWTNAQGVEQGTCVHCGNCDIGCQVKAKNTLDLNYLAWAEKKGAEIRPLHLVTVIEPHEDGYRVHWHRIEGGRRVPGSATGSRVILTAGSLSSTELLLRARDQHKTLPNVSQRLGWNWSSNGDFLTPAIHRGRKVSPTRGPTISSAIDFLDGAVSGQQFFIEDGGFPDVLGNHWAKAKGSWFGRNPQGFLFGKLSQALADRDTLESVMPWFAQGIDAGDGRLRLGRRWYWPFGEKRLMLDWDIARSKGVIDAIVSMHKTLAKRTGGVPLVPITWTWMQNLITPHPLGGCNMGTSPENGVVDHKGEVFGHPGLIVSDGAIVPEALGLNPTRTIAALAERNVAKLIATA
jgi:cholesterol oxidase